MPATNQQSEAAHAPSHGEKLDVLSICLPDDERIELQKAAERCGLALADWIRDRLHEAAKREAKEA